jgi:hypothetical protein
LKGQAADDAVRLLDAIRDGRLYSVIDGLATPGGLAFSARSGSRSAELGGVIDAIDGDVMLRASAKAPPGTTLVLLRDGQRVHEVTDGVLDMNGGTDPAVYRIEAYTSNASGGPPIPWLVSNPIHVGLKQSEARRGIPEPVSRIPARVMEGAAEKGPYDTSVVQFAPPTDDRLRTFAGDPTVAWKFALSPGQAVGQFAAVAIPVSGGLASFDRVRFRVSASAPMRVWVQLRAPVGNTERWGRTFYADTEARVVDVAFATFASIGVTSSTQAPIDRVDSLLFVVDTLNTLPGTSGTVTISEVGFVK